MKCIDVIEGAVKSILTQVHAAIIEDRLDDTDYVRMTRSIIDGTDQFVSKNPELVDDPQLLKQAAGQVQEIYSENVWPELRITWGTYPNEIGHTNSPGCLRCHGNDHVTAEGKPVNSDCRLCHIILALEEENPPLFDYFVHKEQ